MNASIVSGAVQASNGTITSAIPTVTTPIVENAATMWSGMSKVQKVALGAGAAGVVVGAGFIGYKVWQMKHPKPETCNQQPQVPVQQPTLDDEAELEAERAIAEGENLVKAREMIIHLVGEMISKGIEDKGALMTMSAELVSFCIGHDPSYGFIEEAVDAGLASSKGNK